MCGIDYTGFIATEGPLPKPGTKLIEKGKGGKPVKYFRPEHKPVVTFLGTGTYPKSRRLYVRYRVDGRAWGTGENKQREDTFRKRFTWRGARTTPQVSVDAGEL